MHYDSQIPSINSAFLMYGMDEQVERYGLSPHLHKQLTKVLFFFRAANGCRHEWCHSSLPGVSCWPVIFYTVITPENFDSTTLIVVVDFGTSHGSLYWSIYLSLNSNINQFCHRSSLFLIIQLDWFYQLTSNYRQSYLNIYQPVACMIKEFTELCQS